MTTRIVKSAQRAFEIFEAFERERRPMTLKDFTDRYGYPASSASALLKSLIALGYLDYDRFSRTYMPTMRIASMGTWIQGALFGEGEVLDLMRRLHQQTQETVTLGAQSDLVAQYVHVIDSTLPIRYDVPLGATRPLARSGIGWLMLSTRSDATIETLLRRINFHERDPKHRVDLGRLMQRIQAVRRDGYVYSRHTRERDSFTYHTRAVPLP